MADCACLCKFIFLRIRSKKWNLNGYLFHLTSTLSLYCLVLVLLNRNKERTTIYFPFLLEKLLWIIHFPSNNSRGGSFKRMLVISLIDERISIKRILFVAFIALRVDDFWRNIYRIIMSSKFKIFISTHQYVSQCLTHNLMVNLWVYITLIKLKTYGY